MGFDRMSTILLDIQFLIGENGDYIAKEVGYLDTRMLLPEPVNIIFKPPYPFNRLSTTHRLRNGFINFNINGLRWEDGDLEYDELDDYLEQFNGKTILVCGRDKKTFLQRILKTSIIVDLEKSNGITLSKLDDPELVCKIHNQPERANKRCTKNNVFKLFFYMTKNNVYD